MTTVILSGGGGTRLWPLSRQALPKQYCDLLGGATLFERTVARNLTLSENLIVVANVAHFDIAKTQLASSAPYRNAHFILEPCGRNTAPAVTLACLRCDPNEIVLVVPSDHIIQNEEAYRSAVQRAKMAAQEGFLVTFGLTPEYPETGYGYIEADTSHVSQGKSQGKVIELTEAGQKHVTTVAANSDQGYFPIRSFKEKPDRQTAEAYIETGNYFWNSGMFAFRAGTFLEEISKTSSAILEGAKGSTHQQRQFR